MFIFSFFLTRFFPKLPELFLLLNGLWNEGAPLNFWFVIFLYYEATRQHVEIHSIFIQNTTKFDSFTVTFSITKYLQPITHNVNFPSYWRMWNKNLTTIYVALPCSDRVHEFFSNRNIEWSFRKQLLSAVCICMVMMS